MAGLADTEERESQENGTAMGWLWIVFALSVLILVVVLILAGVWWNCGRQEA